MGEVVLCQAAEIRPPSWYESLNEIGSFLGGAEAVADLELESLIRGAGVTREALDMSDEVLADFEQLIAALRNEARLSVVGALLARIELLRALRARAVLMSNGMPGGVSRSEDDPLADRTVVFIIGGPRSGTSGLQRWMANWADVHTPSTVDVLYPQFIGTAHGPELLASVTIQDRLWDAIDAGFIHQHLNRGDLPAECLPVLCAGFISHHWTGCYRLPTYEAHLRRRGSAHALQLHRAFAGRIASASEERVLLFKSPAHAPIMEDLLAAYPDARFVYIDREPSEVVLSHTRLLSTIRSMRSDHHDHEADTRAAEQVVTRSYRTIGRLADAGDLNESNFRLISYRDLLDGLGRVSKALSSWLSIKLSDLAMASLRDRQLEAPLSQAPGPMRQGTPIDPELVVLRTEFMRSTKNLKLGLQ